jgi:predicted enzyme related to lactoylglutathione lyase
MSSNPMGAPRGSGAHPVVMVSVFAPELAASTAFYGAVFGWRAQPLTSSLTAMMVPAGPSIVLRSGDAVTQGVVPFIGVPDVAAALQRIEASGGATERAPWSMPMAGTLARFRDASGTVYGLTSAIAPAPMPHVPMPFGDNPRPPVHSVCSLEMYAADGMAAGAFFGEQFGWGFAETMPAYVGFDAGAGIGGVFQSHTPVAPSMAYVFVDDVSATLNAIDANGGRRMGDAMAMPGMATFGYFTDPSGTGMGLIGR